MVGHGDAAAGSVEPPVVADELANDRLNPDTVKLASLRQKMRKSKH